MTASVATTMRTLRALRYVVPLREGGSLPGVVEADDLGTYVVKFRGAGQGAKVLVAEIVVGELARALGLPVPDLALIELDPALANAEPDEEVQDLLRASAGPLADADAELAPRVDADLLHGLLSLAPDAWLVDEHSGTGSPPRPVDEVRAAYVEVLTARLDAREQWLAPLERLRTVAVDARSDRGHV
jgi:hypothetical protein